MTDLASSEPGAEAMAGDTASSEIDWLALVRSYPVPALLLAAVGGFVLGRRRGPEILGAVSDFAAEEVARNLNSLLGEELIDPAQLDRDEE